MILFIPKDVMTLQVEVIVSCLALFQVITEISSGQAFINLCDTSKLFRSLYCDVDLVVARGLTLLYRSTFTPVVLNPN
jgi:hypothetical protein